MDKRSGSQQKTTHVGALLQVRKSIERVQKSSFLDIKNGSVDGLLMECRQLHSHYWVRDGNWGQSTEQFASYWALVSLCHTIYGPLGRASQSPDSVIYRFSGAASPEDLVE